MSSILSFHDTNWLLLVVLKTLIHLVLLNHNPLSRKALIQRPLLAQPSQRQPQLRLDCGDP